MMVRLVRKFGCSMKIQSNECVLKKYGIEEFETLQMQGGGFSNMGGKYIAALFYYNSIEISILLLIR